MFSSSTSFETDSSYSKFEAYAVLNHDGDFRAAARALREKQHEKDSDMGTRARGGLSLRKKDFVDDGDVVEDAAKKLHVNGVVCLADVRPEKVEWLWEPYIPIGKLTIIEGDPGLGKSWLSLGIATAISLGKGLPALPTFAPRNVLLMSAEDGLGDTIRPRLDAMRADVYRVFAIEETLTFDDIGLARLESHIETHKARAVFVDPWVAYFGGDANKATETRKVLAALAAIAERRRCSIVLIRHLTKGSRDKSMYRGQGNIDITAACRSALLVGCDPSDSTKENRVLIHIKSNLARMGPSLGFSIDRGRFTWGGVSDVTAQDVLAAERPASQERKEAISFLQTKLANGPIATSDVEQSAKNNGISMKTLERARRVLGVIADPIRKNGRVESWTLRLPTTH